LFIINFFFLNASQDEPEFGGTLVTAESFMEWKAAFEAEMRAKISLEELQLAEEKRNRKTGLPTY
jgi:hypothetical protein